MTDKFDIDQLLARAAASERASHVDPAFVQLREDNLNPQWSASLLRLLPAFAAISALFFVVPVLAGLWEAVSESLGSVALLGVAKWLGPFLSMDNAARVSVATLWPYAMGLAAALAPFWLSASDA